jgi:hypothetical protein
LEKGLKLLVALAKDAKHLGSSWFDAGKEVDRLYVRYDPTYGMNEDPTIVAVGDVPNIEASCAKGRFASYRTNRLNMLQSIGSD